MTLLPIPIKLTTLCSVFDVISRMFRFDYTCFLTWNLFHWIKGSFKLFVFIILAPLAWKHLMIILGLFNKLHFGKNYMTMNSRLLSHQKEQISMILVDTPVQTVIGEPSSGDVSST